MAIPQARLAPLPLSEKLRQNTNRRTQKEKVARGVKPNRSDAAKYNAQLQLLVKDIESDVVKTLREPLVRLENEYIQDSYAEQLNKIMFDLAARWRNITRVARVISTQMVDGINQASRQTFYKNMARATGVNLNGIISEEGLEPLLESKIAENVALIQSIPDQYFKTLITIVNEGTSRGDPATSMIQEIRKLGHSTEKRARLIARDQTQKVNSAVTQGRQTALGITEYIWRTSEDERVRESHKSKNGKRFRWDDPPKDTGHPGQDINCRCVAEPVIDFGANEI